MMEFSNVQNLVEEPYRRLGFMGQWNQEVLADIIFNRNLESYENGGTLQGELKLLMSELKVLMDIAEVGLLSEEVGELLDAIRKGERLTVTKHEIHEVPSIGEECADIFIRIANFCNRKGINLEREVFNKNEYNKNRSYLHDKKA